VLVLMAPALVPHVARWVRTFPSPGASGPSSESRVVDRPRGVRGGHRRLGRPPKSAPVDVQCSVIPETTAQKPAGPRPAGSRTHLGGLPRSASAARSVASMARTRT